MWFASYFSRHSPRTATLVSRRFQPFSATRAGARDEPAGTSIVSRRRAGADWQAQRLNQLLIAFEATRPAGALGNAYLFAYAVEPTPGAKTLTMPGDERLRVMAVTVSDERARARPARPLYDTLERDGR